MPARLRAGLGRCRLDMDNVTNIFNALGNALQQIMPFVPAHVASGIYAVFSFVVATAVITRYVWGLFFKPPKPGTKAALVFEILTTLAGMRGFNAPAYGPGFKSLKVPVGTDKKAAAAVLSDVFSSDAKEDGGSIEIPPGKP